MAGSDFALAPPPPRAHAPCTRLLVCYQVCLYCFQKLKETTNLCPGCRIPYGDGKQRDVTITREEYVLMTRPYYAPTQA